MAAVSGFDVVRAHEAERAPVGEARDRLDELGSEGLLKHPAEVQDVGLPAGAHEALPARGHGVLHQIGAKTMLIEFQRAIDASMRRGEFFSTVDKQLIKPSRLSR